MKNHRFIKRIYLFCFLVLINTNAVSSQESKNISCEILDNKKIDFSKEFIDTETISFKKNSNLFKIYADYDYSYIWTIFNNYSQNGIIGENYQRLQIHFDSVKKNEKGSTTYIITGKSNVNNNICNFSGIIKLNKLFLHNDCDYPDTQTKCAIVFGNYVFYEDSLQKHSGVFRGNVECFVVLDTNNHNVLLDISTSHYDGYANRTFVGTWTSYKTKLSKKCIWGDYRLPFTFDFDCGDGEMRVSDKYVQNGWETFNDRSEFIEIDVDKWELRDKWWKK